jgi:hypothetical protein
MPKKSNLFDLYITIIISWGGSGGLRVELSIYDMHY